jgi:hypothetical protein
MDNDNPSPIDFLIDFAWACGASIDVVNEAKQELKKLRDNEKPNKDNNQE